MMIATSLFWVLVVLSIPGFMVGIFALWVAWQWARLLWLERR